LVGDVSGDPAASARAARGSVLSDGEAHPGADLHHRAEREVDPELEVRELPATDAERAALRRGVHAEAHLLVTRAEPDPWIGRGVPQRVPVHLSSEAECARRAADVTGAAGEGREFRLRRTGEPVGKIPSEEPRTSQPYAEVDLHRDGERAPVTEAQVRPAGR